MRTGSYSLEPARSYPPEARRSSSERSSALRPPGERSRPSQREFPKPVREQQPDSSAPELPLLAEMCNTGSQLVKKSRALFPAPKAGLHCGSLLPLSGAVAGWLFPAPKAGLHCGGLDGRGVRTLDALFPAPKAGLHCGSPRLFRPGIILRLFPAPKAGLHCGANLGDEPGIEAALFPAPKAGLHCGF